MFFIDVLNPSKKAINTCYTGLWLTWSPLLSLSKIGEVIEFLENSSLTIMANMSAIYSYVGEFISHQLSFS